MMRVSKTQNTLNALSVAISVVFVAFLFCQYFLIFPYHDDYGLAVLDYVKRVEGFSGQNFSLAQLSSFIYGFYQSWSGRAVPYALQIILFRLGLNWIRITQVLIIVLILFLSVRLSSRGRILPPLLIVATTYFLVAPSELLLGGMYWFSAASTYTWGIPLFLCSFLARCKSGLPGSVSALLLACASLFNEQVALAACSVVVMWPLLIQQQHKIRIPTRNFVIYIAPVVVATCFTVLSPGNFARKAVTAYPSENLLDLITVNISKTQQLLPPQASGGYAALVFISLILLLLKVYQERKKTGFLFSVLGVSTASSLLIGIFSPFFAFVALFGCYLSSLLAVRDRSDSRIIAILSSVGAVVAFMPQLISPACPGRGFIPSFFLMLIPILYSFAIWREEYGIFILTIFFVIAFVLPPAISNTAAIFKGYANNYEALSINHKRLLTGSREFAIHGKTSERFELCILPSSNHAEKMPYDDLDSSGNSPHKHIELWMKKYYSIPASSDFSWSDC